MCDTAGSAQAHRQVPDAGRKFPSYLKHTTGSWDSPVLGFSFLLALFAGSASPSDGLVLLHVGQHLALEPRSPVYHRFSSFFWCS